MSAEAETIRKILESAERFGPHEEVIELQDGAQEPDQSTAHPLTKFVEVDMQVRPPIWVTPGFIAEGLVAIAGSGGVGKTTALLPLAMVAAGLYATTVELAPREWRHVVYVTEDIDQAMRIVTGITQHGNLGIDPEQVRERFHLVEAVRLDPAYAVQAGAAYREQFTRMVGTVEVLPLVVFDTKSAVFEQENENDNAQASRIVAALKQQFADLPCWVIGHVTKANLGRADDLSMRGGGAFGDDAHQTLFLIQEKEDRYLIKGKVRFEPKWPELQIMSHCANVAATDVFGNPENITLRWGIAQPPIKSRKEVASEAAEAQRKDDARQLREDVRAAVETAWATEQPLNKTMVCGKLGGKKQVVSNVINSLLSESWLFEVIVPKEQRLMHNRSVYLVNFSTTEREQFLATGVPPEAKLVVPKTFRKGPESAVPEFSPESAEEVAK